MNWAKRQTIEPLFTAAFEMPITNRKMVMITRRQGFIVFTSDNGGSCMPSLKANEQLSASRQQRLEL